MADVWWPASRRAWISEGHRRWVHVVLNRTDGQTDHMLTIVLSAFSYWVLIKTTNIVRWLKHKLYLQFMTSMYRNGCYKDMEWKSKRNRTENGIKQNMYIHLLRKKLQWYHNFKMPWSPLFWKLHGHFHQKRLSLEAYHKKFSNWVEWSEHELDLQVEKKIGYSFKLFVILDLKEIKHQMNGISEIILKFLLGCIHKISERN